MSNKLQKKTLEESARHQWLRLIIAGELSSQYVIIKVMAVVSDFTFMDFDNYSIIFCTHLLGAKCIYLTGASPKQL